MSGKSSIFALNLNLTPKPLTFIPSPSLETLPLKSESIRVLPTKTEFWYMYEDSSRNMAQVRFIKGLGIASISGRLGNCIFYTRNGKQYVRSTDPHNGDLPAIIEPTTSHLRAINGSDPVLKHKNR